MFHFRQGPTRLPYSLSVRARLNSTCREAVTSNKLGIVLGIVVVAIALVAAPMPLVSTSSSQTVTIYPNLLFAVPLTLLGVLLLLYGIVAGNDSGGKKAVLE